MIVFIANEYVANFSHSKITHIQTGKKRFSDPKECALVRTHARREDTHRRVALCNVIFTGFGNLYRKNVNAFVIICRLGNAWILTRCIFCERKIRWKNDERESSTILSEKRVRMCAHKLCGCCVGCQQQLKRMKMSSKKITIKKATEIFFIHTTVWLQEKTHTHKHQKYESLRPRQPPHKVNKTEQKHGMQV